MYGSKCVRTPAQMGWEQNCALILNFKLLAIKADGFEPPPAASQQLPDCLCGLWLTAWLSGSEMPAQRLSIRPAFTLPVFICQHVAKLFPLKNPLPAHFMSSPHSQFLGFFFFFVLSKLEKIALKINHRLADFIQVWAQLMPAADNEEAPNSQKPTAQMPKRKNNNKNKQNKNNWKRQQYVMVDPAPVTLSQNWIKFHFEIFNAPAYSG